MAALSLPPWLEAVNPAPFYVQGVSQGASIAERQNAAERAIEEMTLRREAQARQREAQELATVHTIQQMGLAKQAADMKAAQAALQWQGQQEYQGLINQGVAPDEAFARTAHKLMPGAALGGFFSRQAAQAAAAERDRTRQGFEERRTRVMEEGLEERKRMNAAKPTTVRTPQLNIQLSNVNSRIRQAEGKMASAKDEDQRALIVSELQSLYDERDAITGEMEAAGATVAQTPRPRFDTVPEVSTPPDIRSPLDKLLPNWFGGRPAPGPVTNMVTRIAPAALPTPPPPTPAPPSVTPAVLDTMRRQNQELGIPVGAANMGPIYKSPDEVKAAYKAGKLTKAEALRILEDNFK